MKRILKCLLLTAVIIIHCTVTVMAEGELPDGYSEWSTESNGDPNEISAIQYGRQLPKEWSEWSIEVPESPYQKEGEELERHYAYEGSSHFWNNARAKTLFEWNFPSKSRIVYFYADVDTYVDKTYTNYSGPPLQLYCDGRQVASTGRHNHLSNWNPDIDCECSILKLTMSSDTGNGRNATCIVGTWATTYLKTYSYVISWQEPGDWRFDEAYPHLYGEESQIPAERTVYSRPIVYHISYDFNGGEAIGEITDSYTVLDEVELPGAHKEGYDFIGWYEGDTLIERIEKGTFRDISLVAVYDRHKPSIFTGHAFFDEDDAHIAVSDLLYIIKASASDEVDGDITGRIKVESITYEKNGTTVNRPSYLDVSTSQSVIIRLSVTNSGGKKAEIERRYYILGKGTDIERDDNLRVCSRFITEDFKETLSQGSIWRNDDYMEVLEAAYMKARKDEG